MSSQKVTLEMANSANSLNRESRCNYLFYNFQQMSYDFDLVGKQILFTNNMFKNKRVISLEKVYELANAHIAVGATDKFIERFLDIKDEIFDFLIRFDRGDDIDGFERITEHYLVLLMEIIRDEKPDDLLTLAIRVEAENYNPYRSTYAAVLPE